MKIFQIKAIFVHFPELFPDFISYIPGIWNGLKVVVPSWILWPFDDQNIVISSLDEGLDHGLRALPEVIFCVSIRVNDCDLFLVVFRMCE